MKSDTDPRTLLRFAPPYTRLEPLTEDADAGSPGHEPPWGEALVWRVGLPLSGGTFERVRARTPGTALVVILPPPEQIGGPADLLRVVELCRPQSVLPHHLEPDILDLQSLLRRPPDDLASDVIDYLAWRGISVDSDTRHLLRRTIELSADLRTVSALSRSLYLSRRALGRRFLSRGIPVPSHWLHVSRILRAVVALQNSRGNLFDVACDLGYPDGFSLSNQMKRLADLRPSAAREHLGWEWVLESWLRKEASSGGFSADRVSLLSSDGGAIAGAGAERQPAPRGALQRRPAREVGAA